MAQKYKGYIPRSNNTQVYNKRDYKRDRGGVHL